jgi:hypothetical protein
MATGITLASSSNLSTTQKAIIAAAKLAHEPAAPDPDLVANETIPQGSKNWNVATYARLSQASQLTEGVDLAQSQQLVTNTVTITPVEHGIIVTLSKRLIRSQGDTNVVTTAGTNMGMAMRNRKANDIIALYDSFSKSVGGAGTTLDITHFRGSVAYLLTDNNTSFGPAPVPLVAALHIEQISDIILDITDTSPRGTTTGFTDEMVQRWWKGRDRLYAVQIFNSGYISRDSDDDSKGAIFNKDSMYYVQANAEAEEQQADISLRATEYGVFQEWSEAQRADVHGVEIYSDTAATV